MSEKERLDNLEKRILRLEKMMDDSTQHPISTELESMIIKNITKISTSNLILYILQQKGEISKEEIKSNLTDMGKIYGKWFNGGNFGNRLLKTGFVKKIVSKDTETTYILTKLGEITITDLMGKWTNGFSNN